MSSKMSKSNVQVFNAVVATAFDKISDIHICGVFFTEKDAVMSVIKKVFENELISRDRYLSLIDESDDESDSEDDESDEDDDSESEFAKITNMTEKQFIDMVRKEVEKNPTIDNLETVLDDYSDCDHQEWSFRITINNL